MVIASVRGGNLSKSAFFEGAGHSERKFLTEGGVAHQPLWCQNSRVIALSCGLKISAMRHLVFVTIHACDRQTDGQTDIITRAIYRALHCMQLHGNKKIQFMFQRASLSSREIR